jgi:uncharacterized membrane protein
MLWHYFALNICMADNKKQSSGAKKVMKDEVKAAAVKEKCSGKQKDVNDDSLVIKNNPDFKSD